MTNAAGWPQGCSQNKHKMKTGVSKILKIVRIFGNVKVMSDPPWHELMLLHPYTPDFHQQVNPGQGV